MIKNEWKGNKESGILSFVFLENVVSTFTSMSQVIQYLANYINYFKWRYNKVTFLHGNVMEGYCSGGYRQTVLSILTNNIKYNNGYRRWYNEYNCVYYCVGWRR